MNGIHDMGGMHGFGRVEHDAPEEPYEAWENRVNAIVSLVLSRGYYTKDASRYGVEQMEPSHYLRARYYERWLASLEYNLTHNGYLAPEEIDARTELLRNQPDAPLAVQDIKVTPAPPSDSEPVADPAPPRFAVGDAVVTRNIHPTGHTRLPRYARGKRGVIQIYHGVHTLPDTNAHGLGPNPQPLYGVRFEGEELWGPSAEPGSAVYLDLWESYLEPPPA